MFIAVAPILWSAGAASARESRSTVNDHLSTTPLPTNTCRRAEQTGTISQRCGINDNKKAEDLTTNEKNAKLTAIKKNKDSKSKLAYFKGEKPKNNNGAKNDPGGGGPSKSKMRHKSKEKLNKIEQSFSKDRKKII